MSLNSCKNITRLFFFEAVQQISNIMGFSLQITKNKDESKEYTECNNAFLEYYMNNANVIKPYVLKRFIIQEVFTDFKLVYTGENFEIKKALSNAQIANKLWILTDTNNGFISYFSRRLI